MAISTNQKSTIYRNLFHNTGLGPESEDYVTKFKHVPTRVTRVSVAIHFCEILAPTLIQVPALVTRQILPGER